MNFCFALVVRLKSQEERVRSQLGQYLDRFDSVYVEMALSCRMTNGTCNILLIAYLLKREKIHRYSQNISLTCEPRLKKVNN